MLLLRGGQAARLRHVQVIAGSKNDRSRKGKQFEQANRRRGRPAWKRNPYDSPLRDGNRDRLIGLLTERATKTLMVYLMELNPTHYSWLVEFYKENPIPKVGTWDDISGETFLRMLLSMPIEEATFKTGRQDLFNNVRSMGVDPRNLAMRIMDIRSQLAKEFIQDLSDIAEENSTLLRETLSTSLLGSVDLGEASSDSDASTMASGTSSPKVVHPEVAEAEASARAKAEAEAAAARAQEELAERQRRLDEDKRRRQEEEQARRVEEERIKAEAEAKRVEEERIKAEAEARWVEEERMKAEAEAKRVEEERIQAEEEVRGVGEEWIEAETEAKRVEEERIKAQAEAGMDDDEGLRFQFEGGARRVDKQRGEAVAEVSGGGDEVVTADVEVSSDEREVIMAQAEASSHDNNESVKGVAEVSVEEGDMIPTQAEASPHEDGESVKGLAEPGRVAAVEAVSVEEEELARGQEQEERERRDAEAAAEARAKAEAEALAPDASVLGPEAGGKPEGLAEQNKGEEKEEPAEALVTRFGTDMAAMVAALNAAFKAPLPKNLSTTQHPEVSGTAPDGGSVGSGDA